MSQVKTLPITATRWLSLVLCAITAATITVFLSKVGFVQKAYSSWSAILNTNPVLHYSSAFLAGIGIKLLLDRFYISHAKRSIRFNWRYPPVTMSVLFGLFFIVSYVYVSYSNEILAQLTAHAFVSFKFLSLSFLAAAATIIYQTKLYTKNPIFSVVLCTVSAFYLFSAISLVETEQAFWVFFCIAVAYLVMSVYLLCEQLKASSAESKVESKQEAELTLESLEDFQRWFKDDSIIKNTGQLEPDLQVYAKRITERLRNGGDDYEEDLAQHIALCGPYGCGKSSIVESIVNDLAKNSEKESIWIHSDISTWGAASDSVAHVVLSNIIDDISQHIDMCAFRALPKHYTEALKSGGGIFQFASTLLAGPIDIEQSFQKLNGVLEVTNHKLLITLQDVDRGTGDENEKRLNDIAALLDRLKDRDLSHINFIVAMGNDKLEYAVALSKVADHTETIVSQDFKRVLCNWAKLCTSKIFDNDMLLPHSSISSSAQYFEQNPFAFHETFYQPAIISNNFIVSIRMLKRLMRRINKCWTKGKLLGEIDFGSLLLLTTLRETEPALFNAFINSYISLINGKSLLVAKTEDGKQKTINEILSGLITDLTKNGTAHIYNALFKELLNLKEDIKDENGNGLKDDKKSVRQHLGVKPDTVNYLNRILLETVPDNELRDQIVIDSIKSLSTQELAKNICSDYRWQEGFDRFGRILFSCDKNQDRVEQIVFDVLDNIGKDPNGFLTEGLFEEYTKQTIDSGNLEGFLNILVNVESGEKLLERQLERLQRNFEGKTKIRDGNGHYRDIKDEADRMEAASYSNELFQDINIVNFLSENAHKLSKQSFYVCLRFITFAQLAGGEFNFLNRLMKNLLAVTISNKNTRTIEFLAGAASRNYNGVRGLQEHFSELSPEQRENILQILAELKDNQENKSDIDLAIKNLSFTEE
ncbi:P-loop NTPase fold protein [uncultured Pseudoalteromonas sp.]|uniref:P-loop NTPase fold protein n=1 Tax=uncultured Pseudoalteromonas sp. TaxID=114053 RepID=UPI0030C815C7